jgi:hypothetical protein
MATGTGQAQQQQREVELRAQARLHGVLTGPGQLCIRRGDVLVVYDLVESWRQGRAVFTVQVIIPRSFAESPKDLPCPNDDI